MKNADVFISYNSKEFNKASWVRTMLETNGISCWMAPADIPGGSSYAAEIPVAIKACKVFVLILSEKAQESKWVPKELDMAIGANKTIMPFMLENCTLRDDFNFYLTNIQRYEAFEDKSRAAEKMVREIKSILNAEKDEKTEKPAEKIPEGKTVVKEEIPVKKEETPVKKEKIPAKKEKPAPKVNPPKKRKSVKKSRIIIPAAVAVLIVAAIALISAFSKVTVGSEKYKRNTATLSFSGEKITEEYVESMLELKKLTNLYFEKCTFEGKTLEKLNSLTQLHLLSIKECGIDDAAIKKLDFEKFAELHTLDVSKNPEVSDLSTVKPAADTIKVLDISDTGITNISFIRNHPGIQKLYADNIKINSTEPLSALTEITTLRINDCGIQSLDFLSGAEKINTLCANNNYLKNLRGIEKCIWLSHIELSENKLEDISALSNATQIETIYLDNNSLSDVSVLVKSAEKLKNLIVSHNKIMKTESFTKLTALENLDISYNNIENIDLSGCSGLKKLSACKNYFTSTPKLSPDAPLDYLDISENAIFLGVTVNPTKLEGGVLDIHDSGIDDASVFFEYENKLQYVDLSDNGKIIYDASRIKADRVIADYDENINIDELKKDVNTLIIKDCPLDKKAEITKKHLFGLVFYEENKTELDKPAFPSFRENYYI